MALIEKDIKSYVESYWPLPETLAAIHRFQTQKYLHYQENSRERRAQQLQERHLQFLKDTFGESLNMWRRLSSLSDGEEKYHLQYSHIYKTGLSDVAPASTVLRSRATLESLLKLLSTQEAFSSLLDLGCGDVRVAGGAALAFENLQTVYAVDCNISAFQAMERWTEKLSVLQQETARRKIVSIEANYADPSFKKRLDLQADLALLAHLPTFNVSLPAAKAYCKSIIAYFETSPSVSARQIESSINSIAAKENMRFTLAHEQRYWSDATVVAFTSCDSPH